MEIIWNPNPLKSIVNLNESELKEFWYKIKIEQMQDDMYEAFFYLKDKYKNLDRVNSALDPDYFMVDEKFDFDFNKAFSQIKHDITNNVDTSNKNIDYFTTRNLYYYVEELKSNHCGDCTCVPASCCKCLAEDILGINTIPGLSKYSASKINSAFANNNNLEQALLYLNNYDPKPSGSWLNYPIEEFNKHLPDWKKQAQQAYIWLNNYKNEYFN